MQKELMDKLCAFRVGDRVTFKAQVEMCKESNDAIFADDAASDTKRNRRYLSHKPQLLIVTTRRAHECYGGVQVEYFASMHDTEHGALKWVLNAGPISELELVAYPKESFKNLQDY